MICYAIIIVSSIANLEFFFYLLLRCVGQGFRFQDTASATISGKCTNRGGIASAYVQTVTNLIVDWTLVLLPIRSVLGTIMDRKVRLSIICILIFGARQDSIAPYPVIESN
jgi:hypothetical protein